MNSEAGTPFASMMMMNWRFRKAAWYRAVWVRRNLQPLTRITFNSLMLLSNLICEGRRMTWFGWTLSGQQDKTPLAPLCVSWDERDPPQAELDRGWVEIHGVRQLQHYSRSGHDRRASHGHPVCKARIEELNVGLVAEVDLDVD